MTNRTSKRVIRLGRMDGEKATPTRKGRKFSGEITSNELNPRY
jgi:hypothetical protein